MLINLLENAGKYAGAHAQIGVNASVADHTLRLDVWDTGPGIPAGQEKAIFENSHGAIKSLPFRGWAGSGDLPAIIDVHGGTISAENRPEGGARFVLHFLWTPRQNLMNYQRICDQRPDCRR